LETGKFFEAFQKSKNVFFKKSLSLSLPLLFFLYLGAASKKMSEI
jgi:hypothetical protein